MKPIVKKVLISAGIVLAISSYLAYEKIEKLKNIFFQLQIKPVNIKNLDISTKRISFITDILFINPTADDFSVSGYIATLKRLNFFYDKKYIGTAKPVVNEIDVPANNQLLFKNLPVVLPLINMISSLSTLINFKYEKLEVEAVIEIAGKEYFIKP